MRIAVITALCGDKEKLHDPKVAFCGVDYFAFVDTPQNVTIWKQLPLLDFTSDKKYKNRRNAKIYKIMPHLFFPDYDVHIWHDVSHELIKDPQNIENLYLKNNDIALFKHSERNCIYKEAEIVKDLGYDHMDLLNRQIDYYRSISYPENNGLYELPVLIRKNIPKIQVMNMRWWETLCRYSSRDQLSLPVCLYELGIVPSILPGCANGFNKVVNDIIPQVRLHVSSGV